MRPHDVHRRYYTFRAGVRVFGVVHLQWGGATTWITREYAAACVAHVHTYTLATHQTTASPAIWQRADSHAKHNRLVMRVRTRAFERAISSGTLVFQVCVCV